MLTLIRNADVYAPTPLGKQDILLAGGKVAKMAPRLDLPSQLDVVVIDAMDRLVVPGLVDYHMHFLGGGGGSGFSSRVPEIAFSQLPKAGITTAVGCLGRDNHTKSMEGLLGKAHALEEDGITAYIYTGATLEHPVPTLTGSVRRDIIYCDKVIGVGEVSISELGPSNDTMGPGTEYIAKLAAEALIAGRASRKSGILNLQVPPRGELGMEPVFEIIHRTKLPITQFIPSHINASRLYLEQAKKFARMGGIADLCSNYCPERLGHESMIPAVSAAEELLAAGVPPAQITMSTDGNGAHPSSDPSRSIYMPVASLWEETVSMVGRGLPLETCLQFVTSNPARAAGLRQKGQIEEGADADLLIVTKDLEIDKTLARGRLLVDQGRAVVKNQYEGVFA